MMMSYKVMLLPNNKQNTRLLQYAGAARYAYNWTLAEEDESLMSGNGFIPEDALRKEFTQVKKLPGNEWMNTISNNVFKQAIKDCCRAYGKFFKRKKQHGYKPYTKKCLRRCAEREIKPGYYHMDGHPKFKCRKDKNRYGFYQDVYKIEITSTHVFIEKLSGSNRKSRKKCSYIRLAEKGRIPLNVSYANPRITYDGINWWLSVSAEAPVKEKETLSGSIGIDLGIKETAVCSDGAVYKNINKTDRVRKLKKRKRRLQRSVSRKYMMNKKGESYCRTCNIIKSEKKQLKLEHMLTNIRTDYIHKMTSEIVGRKPTLITMEDLNIAGMMKNEHLAGAIQEQKLYEIRKQVEYKAAYNQIPVVFAGRWYPSSKTCSNCGFIHSGLKLKDRTFICPSCGFTIDRDLNAAVNLDRYGMKEVTA